MTKDEVMAIEGDEPDYYGDMTDLDATYIGYKAQLMGMDCILAFYFCDEGLYEARYLMIEEHTAETKYITDYDNIRSALTKKYGAPLIDNEKWDTTSHKEYYEGDQKARALEYGFLTYNTIYSLDESYIYMTMSAEDYTISTTISYCSKTISPGEADYSDQL